MFSDQKVKKHQVIPVESDLRKIPDEYQHYVFHVTRWFKAL